MGKTSVLPILLAASAFAQPPALTLRIETAGGKTQFRIGEAISLKLTFDISSTGPWEIRGITGRERSIWGMNSDRFQVSPEQGTSDPSGFRLRGGGGSGPLGIHLSGKSSSTNMDLNQWVRFEQPGRYRVSALFHARGEQQQDLALNSNEVQIEIVPADRQWAADQLRQAVAVLEAPASLDQQSFNARAAAVRTIWYLDTPDSVREAARLIGTLDAQTAQPLELALRGSQHRDIAAAAMKQLLPNPDQPVPPAFIQTLALLGTATEQQLRTDLGVVVERKQGEAKAISLKTLLDTMRPDEVPANMRAEIAGLFLQLPWAQQNELLNSQWKRVAGPAMIPVLRQIYENPQTRPGQQSLAPAAVKRLYELDPARARTLILDEVKSEHPTLPYETLAMLDDATLPEMNHVLLDHLERNTGMPALIERYATADILDGVKAWYVKRDAMLRSRRSPNLPDVTSSVCDPALFAYFLRVDPAWGEQLLRQAVNDRGPYPRGGCWTGIIGRTASYYVSPAWEKVAIETLQDGVVAVRSDAVRALGDHGSPAAQQAVMDAFRSWHDWWKDRPAEMVTERQLENVFLSAAARGKNWIANRDQLEKIRDYCITSGCRTQAEEYVREWSETLPVTIGVSSEGEASIMFAQYHESSMKAAKSRLLQVPAGTRLRWNVHITLTPEIEAWRAATEEELTSRGVIFTP